MRLYGLSVRPRQGFCGFGSTADLRYFSGSTVVKSEIVVPIIVNKLVAELDIESYFPSTFNQSEQQFVAACAGGVGKYLAGL
jgi:putative methionine-R-sulfoxide reductase with GAF domain